jgi:hypothetical protein
MNEILSLPQDAKAPVAAKRVVNSPRKRKKLANNLKIRRPFPGVSLEESLGVPLKIKELNGGNPWTPADLAKAITGGSHKSTPFYYLTAGARDYGLTNGTRDSEQIGLADVGRRFVYAGTPEEEKNALRVAFFNVPIFKQVYEHYKGSTLPDLKYLGNTLQSQFKLEPSQHQDFHRIFQENCRFLQKYGEIDSANDNEAKGSPVASVITLASPEKGTALRAFVALPFSERLGKWPKGFFSEVLNALIAPAGVGAGFKVETARREGSDVIQATIVNDLNAADLVIADLTDHNPNVLFELGMRIAFNRPVALIRAEGTGPIFDIDNLLRVFEYSPNLWKSTLESDIPKLTAHIRGTWDARTANKSYLQILKEQA